MSCSWDSDIRYVKGIGEARAKAFAKLGVRTAGDLLCLYPRRYEDRRQITDIVHASVGQTVSILAKVVSPVREIRTRRGLVLYRLQVADDTGSLQVTFFNQPYLRTRFKADRRYLFYGKIGGTLLLPEMSSPEFEEWDEEGGDGAPESGRIVAVYPLTAGLSRKIVSRGVRQVLAEIDSLSDPLPDAVREKWHLPDLRTALFHIHFPQEPADMQKARDRLAFDEFLTLQLGFALLRDRRKEQTGVRLQKPTDLSAFRRALGFSLTGAQERAIAEGEQDLHRGEPMNRLIQGDVGSGKTAVAAALAYMVMAEKWQTALMVPTEILATQHFQSLAPLMERLGFRTALITGSLTAKEKRIVCKEIASGEVDLVVGTHALIQQNVEFRDLGLVIADEQHRFGVKQRGALAAKGDCPHALIMSATPIPRTLAMMVYGDLDVSVIDELPPGRRPVGTFVVNSSYRARVLRMVLREAQAGRQTYIVCPLVEEDESLEIASVTAYARELRQGTLSSLRIGVVHGKMKTKDKDAVMAAFAGGQLQVLVSTTVIEVGVNVPNATVMIVENAERFGLSQLHQLRGRVGRGSAESYCVLFSDSQSGKTRARLQIMKNSSDGFRIAEEDLRLRGPGDFFGKRQHGLPELKIADLTTDMRLLERARRSAQEIIIRDKALALPEHKELALAVERLFRENPP